MTDLEQLHNSLPKLEVINLEGVNLIDERRRSITDQTPSHHIKSFTLISNADEDAFENDTNHGRFDTTLCDWISYAGSKFPNAENFHGTYPCGYEPVLRELVATKMVNALSRLSHISTFYSSIHPHFGEVVQALDNSKCRLLKLWLNLGSSQQMNQEFSNVMSSTAARSTQQLIGTGPDDTLNLLDLQINLV